MSKSLVLVPFLALSLLLTSCTAGLRPPVQQSPREDETTRLIESLKKTARENEQSQLTFESHLLLGKLLRKMTEFQGKAATFVTALEKYRAELPTATESNIEWQRVQLNSNLDDVLGSIAEIETLFSKDVLAKLKKDADKSVINSPEEFKKIYSDLAAVLAHMNAERNVYLLHFEAFSRDTELRYAQLGKVPPKWDAAKRRADSFRRNPIVNNLTDGGQVKGQVKDALTGTAIPDAFVGFKEEQGDKPYFKETRTDADGKYESPYLLPGRYYVDILKEGRIENRDSKVEVERNIVRNHTSSLTQPVGEGKFRIVMTWCDGRVAGAVRDVDSHLVIPGAARMLYYPLKATQHEGAHLDLDNTNWSGPETTTIHEVRRGTYKFFVNNYSSNTDKEALGKSEVHVEVFNGSKKVRDYRLNPAAGTGLRYDFFHIVDGAIQDVERYDDGLPASQ